MGNVLIPESLFKQIVQYHLSDDLEEWELIELQGSIRFGLQMKLEAMERRQSYTKYKTAGTEQEREEGRQQYLDQRGVPDSFRW